MFRLFCLLLVVPFFGVLAEDEPERGRMEDGRAYRTDEGGFQVVDYLAELEMTVEEQKRQILALKNELAAAARPAVAPLAEKNLLTGEVKKAAESDNSAQLAAYQSQISSLQNSLQERDRQITQLNAKVLTLQSDSNLTASELQNVRASLSMLEKNKQQNTEKSGSELQTAQMKIQAQSAEISRLSSELQKMQAANQDLSGDASGAQNELVALKLKISESEKLITSQSQEIARLNAGLQKATVTPQSVSVKTPAPHMVPPAATRSTVAPSDTSRSKAFTILADNIGRDIVSAHNLEKERQSLFKTYKSNPKSGSLAFNLTPAKTSEGVALGDMNSLLSNADSFADLSRVQKSLLYISKALKSDVELLRRLVK